VTDSNAPTADASRSALKGKRVGTVVSDKRDKTRTVAVAWQQKHPKYGKYIAQTTKFHVHDEDNSSRLGDRVEIAPCRPLSKTKNWRLTQVLEKAPEQVTHHAAHPAEDQQPEEPEAADETALA